MGSMGSTPNQGPGIIGKHLEPIGPFLWVPHGFHGFHPGPSLAAFVFTLTQANALM